MHSSRLFSGDKVLRISERAEERMSERDAIAAPIEHPGAGDWQRDMAEDQSNPANGDPASPRPAAHETSLLIDVRFRGDEVLRIGRMLRAEADGKFSTFVHDLAMQAVADWEAERANGPAATTAAD